ncbi:endonuclease VII domain-containing protein [Actinoplanes sp. NPDC048967]|uniref:endonuclease VII domain-containing protein n=1 Tax=Actinoplanes sp. NPDC048967 TaxID=3155269 RepID=UPI0033C169E3
MYKKAVNEQYVRFEGVGQRALSPVPAGFRRALNSIPAADGPMVGDGVGSPRSGKRQWSPHLRRRYGVGQVEFDEMVAEQGGVCAIRGASDPQHVDHDHRTGWVRGILCFNCNGGLGQFRDNPVFLAEAITYLKGTTWQRVLIHPGVFQMCSPMRGRPPSRSS